MFDGKMRARFCSAVWISRLSEVSSCISPSLRAVDSYISLSISAIWIGFFAFCQQTEIYLAVFFRTMPSIGSRAINISHGLHVDRLEPPLASTAADSSQQRAASPPAVRPSAGTSSAEQHAEWRPTLRLPASSKGSRSVGEKLRADNNVSYVKAALRCKEREDRKERLKAEGWYDAEEATKKWGHGDGWAEYDWSTGNWDCRDWGTAGRKARNNKTKALPRSKESATEPPQLSDLRVSSPSPVADGETIAISAATTVFTIENGKKHAVGTRRKTKKDGPSMTGPIYSPAKHTQPSTTRRRCGFAVLQTAEPSPETSRSSPSSDSDDMPPPSDPPLSDAEVDSADGSEDGMNGSALIAEDEENFVDIVDVNVFAPERPGCSGPVVDDKISALRHNFPDADDEILTRCLMEADYDLGDAVLRLSARTTHGDHNCPGEEIRGSEEVEMDVVAEEDKRKRHSARKLFGNVIARTKHKNLPLFCFVVCLWQENRFRTASGDLQHCLVRPLPEDRVKLRGDESGHFWKVVRSVPEVGDLVELRYLEAETRRYLGGDGEYGRHHANSPHRNEDLLCHSLRLVKRVKLDSDTRTRDRLASLATNSLRNRWPRVNFFRTESEKKIEYVDARRQSWPSVVVLCVPRCHIEFSYRNAVTEKISVAVGPRDKPYLSDVVVNAADLDSSGSGGSLDALNGWVAAAPGDRKVLLIFGLARAETRRPPEEERRKYKWKLDEEVVYCQLMLIGRLEVHGAL